jgi:hypothetical protein
MLLKYSGVENIWAALTKGFFNGIAGFCPLLLRGAR